MSKKHEEPEDNAEEQYCHLMLSELRKSYELAAKPYIDRLVKIKSLRTPVIILSNPSEMTKLLMSHRPETEAKIDGPCTEGDGCPTEIAVLKREWRQLKAENSALGVRVKQLEAENKELRRKLARMNEMLNDVLGASELP